MLPSCDVRGVRGHSPRIFPPPRCGNVAIIVSVHGYPDFVDNIFHTTGGDESFSIWCVTHPAFGKKHAGTKGQTWNIGFRCTYLRQHGTTPRPIDAPVQRSALHTAMNPPAFHHHRHRLRALMNLSRHQLPMPSFHMAMKSPAFHYYWHRAVHERVPPPAAHAFTQRSLCTLKPLPIAMKKIHQDIEHLLEGQVTNFLAVSHLQCCLILVLLSACPPQRFQFDLLLEPPLPRLRTRL